MFFSIFLKKNAFELHHGNFQIQLIWRFSFSIDGFFFHQFLSSAPTLQRCNLSKSPNYPFGNTDVEAQLKTSLAVIIQLNSLQNLFATLWKLNDSSFSSSRFQTDAVVSLLVLRPIISLPWPDNNTYGPHSQSPFAWSIFTQWPVLTTRR